MAEKRGGIPMHHQGNYGIIKLLGIAKWNASHYDLDVVIIRLSHLIINSRNRSLEAVATRASTSI